MRARLETKIVRWVIPTVIAVAGVVMLFVGGDLGPALGVALFGVALLAWWAGIFARLSLDSEDERAEEERAREYFSRHGHWPDEQP